MSGVGFHSVGTRISECSTCETPLPLCEALIPEESRLWICSHCGAEISAALASNYTIGELRGVRPAPVIFNTASMKPIDHQVLEFAQRFGARENSNVEKRNAPRHPVIATLTAMEFDEQLRPAGPPFQTICRNLSTGGIGLINDRAIRSDFLVIEFRTGGGVPIQTLAHVRRRRPLGPYHDIGTEFVTKLATSNAQVRG